MPENGVHETGGYQGASAAPEAPAAPAGAPSRRREPDLVVILPGPVRGKGDKRSRVATARDGRTFVHVFPDAETKSYTAQLKYAATEAMRQAGRVTPDGTPRLFTGALRVRINALFAVPGSWSNKQRGRALNGEVRPTVKPDWDNVAKMCDAFKGIIWRDDVQIVDGRVVKAYAEAPAYEIEIWEQTGLLL